MIGKVYLYILPIVYGERMNDVLKEKLKLLPELPGCYLYKDNNGEIIYVGKAKVIKNRVKSYFSENLNKKTESLVKNISDLEFIIVNSEKEALILESNLIKKYKPYYNIKLKDDKSYPYLMITKESHPRLLLVRKFKKNSKDIYFGPYVDIKSANNLKKIIDKIYPLRKCNPIEKRACTYYQIGECIGSCAKNIDRKEYDNRIAKIKSFLSGKTESVIKDLNTLMQKYIDKLEFENAKQIHEYINSINKSVETQSMSSNGDKDIDYIGYYYNENYICIQMFLYRFGSIIERKVEYFDLYTDYKEILITYLNQYYLINKAPHTIYIDGIEQQMLSNFLDIETINPSRGKHVKVLNTLKSNAKYYLENEVSIIERKEEKDYQLLEKLAKKLMIESLDSIDIFDNSNIMGRDAVSVKVNFLKGKKIRMDTENIKLKLSKEQMILLHLKKCYLEHIKIKTFLRI